MKRNKTLTAINGTDLNFVPIIITIITIIIIVLFLETLKAFIIILTPKEKRGGGIVKYLNHKNKRELEDWGHCWVIQQNVNENSSATPDVLFQQHNYPKFIELSQHCDVQIKLQIQNKTKNVPPIPGRSSSVVTEVTITNNNNNNNGDNRSSNPSDFVTSLNVAIDTLTNVVPTTTPSIAPSDIELSIPPHYYSPSLPSEEISDTPPHSSLFDDYDDTTVEMYNNLISGAQTAAKQADK
jgi:hypothetical protein